MIDKEVYSEDSVRLEVVMHKIPKFLSCKHAIYAILLLAYALTGCSMPARAPYGRLIKVFPNDPGYPGVHFQSDRNHRYIFFYHFTTYEEKGTVFKMDLSHPRQPRHDFCRLGPYPGYFELTEWEVSPDQMFVAYISGRNGIYLFSSDNSQAEHFFPTGEKRVINLAWPDSNTQHIYYAWDKDGSGGIDLLDFKTGHTQAVVPKSSSVDIHQVLQNNILVYQQDRTIYAVDFYKNNKTKIFACTRKASMSGFSRRSFRISPDMKFAAVSFYNWGNWNPLRGVWLIRLRDGKAVRILENHDDAEEEMSIYGLSWAANGKKLFLFMNWHNDGFVMDRGGPFQMTVIPDRTSSCQLYSLDLGKAYNALAQNANTHDFSKNINGGIDIEVFGRGP